MLPIHVRCATPSAAGDESIRVRATRKPLWYHGPIPPAAQPPQLADLAPTDIVVQPLPAGVRDHALRLPVPVGEIQVEVFERCGTYRETVVVEQNADELAPLRFGDAHGEAER